MYVYVLDHVYLQVYSYILWLHIPGTWPIDTHSYRCSVTWVCVLADSFRYTEPHTHYAPAGYDLQSMDDGEDILLLPHSHRNSPEGLPELQCH